LDAKALAIQETIAAFDISWLYLLTLDHSEINGNSTNAKVVTMADIRKLCVKIGRETKTA
jgi:hypothetical protein